MTIQNDILTHLDDAAASYAKLLIERKAIETSLYKAYSLIGHFMPPQESPEFLEPTTNDKWQALNEDTDD